jgi:N-acetylneuraminic acid mutarotase
MMLRAVCLLVAGCNATTPSMTNEPEWRALASLPAARQETAVAAIGGKIYVIGGFNGAATVVDTVEVYDPASDEWSPVAPLPEPLHHTNVAAVGGKLYLLGGLRGLSFEAIGSAWSYDPANDRWDPLTALPPGSERGSSMTAAIGSKIYVAGGYREGRAVDDFQVYDTTTDAWTPLPRVPIGRDHGVGAAARGLFFAIGGRNVSPNGHMPQVHAFDPAQGSWSDRAPLPTSRGGCAAAVLDETIIVAGGEGNLEESSGVFGETERYDPMSDRWTSLPPMRTPRHGTGAAVVDGIFYVPGGAGVQAFGAVATVEALTL